MPDPVVATSSGSVRGVATGKALAFLGIPYAQAARFEAPRPAHAWSGIRSADNFGPMAPQTDPRPNAPGYGIILETMGLPTAAHPPESEACQVLNVWTANLSPERLKPVMVWLHPGFFMVGAGTSGNGRHLAERGDVVVVSLNHRLNLFGFTHLDDIAPGFEASGNAGMLDIVAALQWVRHHIDRFGGDPNRIMVFGASGGGMKTAWLMASPAGQGLLHRAGSQSGPCLGFMARDAASAMSEQLLRLLGLKASEADTLRTLPMASLLAAYHHLRTHNPPSRFTHLASFAPVLDAHLLPHHPFAPDAAPMARNIPMLIGWNRQDMAFFAGSDLDALALDDHGLTTRLTQYFGARGAVLARHYRAADPAATASEIWLRIYSDYAIGGAVLTQAERHSASLGAPTFVYRFDYPSPALGDRLGAVHSSETAYVFGTPGPFADDAPQAAALAQAMQDSWVHFAATGDVNVPGGPLPHWPAFGARGEVMRLGAVPHVHPNPIPDHRAWAVP